jgi:hypothetical protein
MDLKSTEEPERCMASHMECSAFGSHSRGHYCFIPDIQTLEYELKTDQGLFRHPT